MADTYKLAREVDTRVQEERKKLLSGTSSAFQKLMADWQNAYNEMSSDVCKDFSDKVNALKPSGYLKQFEKDIKKMIGQENLPLFYYEIDNVKAYQYSQTTYRRSFRSSDYRSYMWMIKRILEEFIDFYLLKVELGEYLLGNISEEMSAYKKNRGTKFSYVIAAKLDNSDRKLMDAITDIVNNDGGDVSYGIIRGVFMSSNKEMYELMKKLLLAARLQEGLRQAVCENMDCGTKEAFLYMFDVILENDLIRLASVQRAFETFTGLSAVEEKGGDRINKKQLALMNAFLKDPSEREKAFTSDDHMEIYLGLWALGTDDVENACQKAVELVNNGDREQRLTAAYFLEHFSYDPNVFLDIFEKKAKDLELIAILMNGFMCSIQNAFHIAVKVKDGAYREYVTNRIYAEPRYYFKDEKEARRAYEVLKESMSVLPGKKIEYDGIVFPWHKVTLSKVDYVTRMAYCASASKDPALTLEAAREISSVEKWCREAALTLLLNEPVNREEYEILTREAADAEEYARERAFKMLKHEVDRDTTDLEPSIAAGPGKLPEFCYEILEDMLRLKKSDLRTNVITLLYTMEDEEKVKLVGRLLSDKSEEKRAAGLDILLQMKKDNSASFTKAAEKTSVLSSPTSKEQILLDEIHASSEGGSDEEDEGLGIFDPSSDYEPVFDQAYLDECNAVWDAVLPNKKLGKKLLSGKTKFDDIKILHALDDLIEKNKDLEYPCWGEMRLLGNGIRRLSIQEGTGLPFPELWESFYNDTVKTPEALFRVEMLLSVVWSTDRCGDVKGYLAFCDKYIEKLMGPEFLGLDKSKFKRYSDFQTVINYLYEKHDAKTTAGKIACAVCYHIATTDDPMIFTFKKEDVKDTRYAKAPKDTLERTPLLFTALQHLALRTGSDIKTFPFRYALMKKFDGDFKRDYDFKYFNYYYTEEHKEDMRTDIPSVAEYIAACAQGVITKDFLYKHIFNECIGTTFVLLSNAILFIREYDDKKSSRAHIFGGPSIYSSINELLSRPYRTKVDPESITEEDKKILKLAEECYETVISYCVGKELKRGDMPTPYSKKMNKIVRIYGLSYFVGILKAFGKSTFNRSKYLSYSAGDSKVDVLSYLLGVCVPDPKEGDVKEQAEKLKEMIKGTDIKEKRLIEAGLFSPEWLDIIGEILGYEGFKSGCYYFMAHMNERFDDRRKAAIAKYSPISPEDFNNGAFDKTWFDEVYAVLGEKKFDVIYDAAKYISDGAKHARARKYADAATGKLDPKKTREEIEKKRNKDLLMAYAIINGNDKELRDRYAYIRQFIKESRQFGAQRRASEKLAGETAIKNMAMAQGYPDETRFILKMENDIASELSSFWEKQKVEDVEVCLTVDAGKVEMQVFKAGKELKSLPAKLKKDERISDFQEAKKTFTEQYRRTRIMLEEAMESKTSFTSDEIDAMRKNPVLTGMVDALVFESNGKFGLWGDLAVKKGADVFVAHPFSMFAAGVWKDMQALIFEKEIAQPFKQVFRELYVKTAEEKEAFDSRRYAGNQIQPKRTVAVLKNRRWIADVEEGLQKVYYKENIIATIYALADWFSPSDTEAPTLEWVAFYDRKTFEPMKIEDVPDILFSEVMRDVDLAVSVAHAGEVDPEMSHSTVEMRRAIAEFTCKSFKLSNVTFTASHAKIKGTRANYSVHLGSGVIHLEGGLMINVLPVHSQRRGRIFLPFVDDDPKTAEVISKILLFAEDQKIKDPFILEQIV